MNPLFETLKSEVERLFTLSELNAIMVDYLDLDPGGMGLEGLGKAARVGKLFEVCGHQGLVGALADVVIGLKGKMVDPRVHQIPRTLAPYDAVDDVLAGRYAIGREIGRGGFGVIYEAALEGDDARFAAKIVRPDIAGAPTTKSRYLTFMRLLEKRSIEGLPPIEAVGVASDGAPFVIYRRLEGTPLDELIGDEGLGFMEAREVLIAVAKVLGTLHENGVVYADLRPSKVIVSGEEGDRNVTLLLPGNYRLLSRPQGDVGHTVVPVGGAPAYMPPERIRGSAADKRTDVYLFGLLATETVTGQLPFKGKSPADFYAGHLGADPELPGKLRPRAEIPDSFDKFVTRCLEKEPGRRFADFTMLGRELDELYVTHEEALAIKAETRPATVEEFEAMASEFLEDPDVEEIVDETIILARGSGAWERLIEVMNEGVEKTEHDEDKARILFRLAKVYEQEIKDFDEAAATYRLLLELDPEDATARSSLQHSLRKAMQWEDLVDILLDGVAKEEDRSERDRMFLDIARLYEHEIDQPYNALVVLLPLLTSNPTNEEVVSSVRRLAKATNKWDEVLAAINQTIDQPGNPRKAAALCNLVATVYMDEVGRADFAVPYFQKALAISPNDDEALRGLEALYRTQSNHEELASVLQRRIEATQSPAEKRNIQADLASIMTTNLGDQARAVELYEEILDQDPAHDEAFASMERILVRDDRWADLAKITEARARAAGDEVTCRDAYYLLAETYDSRLQDLDKAAECFRKVLEIQPDHVPSLKALEVIFAQTGDFKGLDSILETQTGLTTTPKQQVELKLRRASIHEEEFLDHEASLEIVDQALDVDAKNHTALTVKARLLRKLERWEDILDVMDRQLEIEDDDERRVELHRAHAALLVEKFGRFWDAAERLEKALEIMGGMDTGLVGMIVEACEKAERFDAAVSWLEKLAGLEEGAGERAERLVSAGEILENRLEDRERAIKLYRKALDADPNNVKAAAAMRSTFASRGDHGAALDMLRKEIEATEGDLKKAKLYGEMGRIARTELKEDEQAIEFYEKAHELDPTLVEAGESLAELYRSTEQWELALRIFEKFAASAEAMESDKAAELFLRFGEACLMRDDLDGAKKALTKAREFDPKDNKVLKSCAQVAFLRNEHEEAASLYDDYLLRMGAELEEVEEVEILVRLARSARELGDMPKAIEKLDSACEIDGSNSEVLELRADIHEQRQEWTEAVEDLRALMASGLDDDRRFAILVRIADLFKEKIEDNEKAAKNLQAALEIRTEDRACLVKLMQVNMSLERWSKVVDVVLKLADLVEDKRELSTYYKTAATLNDHYLERKDDALTYYELALDNDTSQFKLFDAMVTILTEKKDWKELERAYQKMIDRLPEGVEASTKANLWHSLGEVYHHRLEQVRDAINAYETALKLEPTQRNWQEVMADLYGDDL
ncbi:MAG: tetratricopeptide repeat protein, partial [Deltaproteobacteria bacterium]|nr:tetratricopeptide repeat protein [Deltaproteobacteria bacterium]